MPSRVPLAGTPLSARNLRRDLATLAESAGT